MKTIFETTNYEMFKFLDQNRQPQNRPMLTDSIKKHGLLMPIDVNEKMQIIDGQHRFLACKQLGLPVQYRVVYYDTKLLFEVNNLQQKWGVADWLNAARHSGHGSTINFYNACGHLMNNDNVAVLAECYATGTGNMVRAIKNFLGLQVTDRGTSYRVDLQAGNFLFNTFELVLKYKAQRLTVPQLRTLKTLLFDNEKTIDAMRLRDIVLTGDIYPTTDFKFYREQLVRLYNKGLRVNRIK